MDAEAPELEPRQVSVAEAKKRFSELLRRAEIAGESTLITRRGRVVAAVGPAPASAGEHWVYRAQRLFAARPEVSQELAAVHAERQARLPRDLDLPWDEDDESSAGH